jgi:glycine/D-amino acid oxidase-like deaminating enzyme
MAKGVQLYTGVHVQKISNTRPGFIVIETSEGSIKADQVIVATNAFTPLLFPELSAIECYPSQILNLEHVKNKLNGMTITENCGDIYYNFPASKAYAQDDDHSMGMLHFGLDSTQPIQHLSDLNRDENKSELEFQQMMSLIHERFPDTKQQPPSRFWRGPMAFTPDRTPVIGFMFSKQPPHLNQKEVIIAAGFQGYGGSYCTQAGYIAAQMALTGEVQEDAPEDLFGTTRFLDSKFLSAPRH